MNFFKCIFQGFWPYFQRATLLRGYLSNSRFCKTPLSGCFCILCSLWLRNFKWSSLFKYFHLSTFYDNECDNFQEKAYEIYYVIYCTDMGTSVSCDFLVSSLLIIFTSYMNKSYKNIFQWQTRSFIFVS